MRNQRGFSLIETVMSLGVLTVGTLGAAGALTAGMRNIASAPTYLIASQKAAEAMESVFSVRDSHTLTWAQICNVNGSGHDGGIFLDGAQPMKLPGPDGLVNTADDTTVETVVLPGPDQLLNTADDQTVSLARYTREIAIRDVELGLRSITVTITYPSGSATRTYTLVTFISNYS